MIETKDSLKLGLIVGFSLAACLTFVLFAMQMNNYWLAAAGKLTLFLGFSLTYFCLYSRRDFKPLFELYRKKYILISVVFGIVTFVSVIGGYYILRNQFNPAAILASLANSKITETTYPFVFIYIVVVNALLEEFFFRGFMFLTLFRLGYKKFAYIFSALLFSLYHYPIIGNVVSPLFLLLALVGLFAGGSFLNEVTRRCKNIWGALIIHIGANLAINSIAAYFFYF